MEVVRWEESKKWQRKVETLRKKLSEKNAEIETCQKYISSLKDTLARYSNITITFILPL